MADDTRALLAREGEEQRGVLPGWLHDAVLDGLAALWVLPFEHKPAADAMKEQVGSWLLALAAAEIDWNEALDKARVWEGFARLCRGYRFPVPGHLLAAMPDRPLPRMDPGAQANHQGWGSRAEIGTGPVSAVLGGDGRRLTREQVQAKFRELRESIAGNQAKEGT